MQEFALVAVIFAAFTVSCALAVGLIFLNAVSTSVANLNGLIADFRKHTEATVDALVILKEQIERREKMVASYRRERRQEGEEAGDQKAKAWVNDWLTGEEG